MTLKGQFFTTM